MISLYHGKTDKEIKALEHWWDVQLINGMYNVGEYTKEEYDKIMSMDSEKLHRHCCVIRSNLDWKYQQELHNYYSDETQKIKKGNTLTDFLKENLPKYEAEAAAKSAKAEKAKANHALAKKRYKSETCSSLQVFLNKELVHQFKSLVKSLGFSQSEVIELLVVTFISQPDSFVMR